MREGKHGEMSCYCKCCSLRSSSSSQWQTISVFQGCLVAPTLSIGSILLQQAAISASFHYNNVEIVESRPNARVRRLKRMMMIVTLNCVSNIGCYRICHLQMQLK